MTSSIGKYASSYEEAVFKGHPDKVVRSDVRPADYISSSRLGSFWATRAEELLILLFLALVIGYCTGFYVVGWTALLPVRLVMSYGWDLLLASAMLLRLHGGSYLAPYLPSPSTIPLIFHSSQSLALSRPPPLAPTRPRPLAPAATAHFASAPAHSRPLRPPLRAAPAREKGGRSHAGRGAGGGQGEAEGGGARLLLEAQRRAPRVRARRRGPLALRLGGRPLLLGRVFLMACARAGECVVMRGSPSRAVRGVL
uniref:Uncharacterized protein n=2 Tax=Emiliania huxleyi TaxID=2903 RepID=A0A7S3WR31_EMIHU